MRFIDLSDKSRLGSRPKRYSQMAMITAIEGCSDFNQLLRRRAYPTNIGEGGFAATDDPILVDASLLNLSRPQAGRLFSCCGRQRCPLVHRPAVQ